MALGSGLLALPNQRHLQLTQKPLKVPIPFISSLDFGEAKLQKELHVLDSGCSALLGEHRSASLETRWSKVEQDYLIHCLLNSDINGL